MSQDDVVAFRMLVPECNKICGIEIIRGPFALDGYWSLSAGSNGTKSVYHMQLYLLMAAPYVNAFYQFGFTRNFSCWSQRVPLSGESFSHKNSIPRRTLVRLIPPSGKGLPKGSRCRFS